MPIEQRAQPPRPPRKSPFKPSAFQQQRERARLAAIRARLNLEQRSLLRGLIVLAVLILLASFIYAGFDRLFVPGWWRQW